MDVEQEATTRVDLLSLPEEQAIRALADHFEGRGQRPYRVRQVRAWLYERDATSFAEMTDLPLAEREALSAAFELAAPELVTGGPHAFWTMTE